MPEKRTAAKRTPAKKTTAKKTDVTEGGSGSPPRSGPVAPSAFEARLALACPRCGTSKFAPEQRTRFEGSRTVRYTVLVCERGHTFARPRSR